MRLNLLDVRGYELNRRMNINIIGIIKVARVADVITIKRIVCWNNFCIGDYRR